MKSFFLWWTNPRQRINNRTLWRRASRACVSTDRVLFPRNGDREGWKWGVSWPGGLVCSQRLNERHWTRWRHSRPLFRFPVQPTIPTPSRWPEISRESKDARSSRAGYEWILRIRISRRWKKTPYIAREPRCTLSNLSEYLSW